MKIFDRMMASRLTRSSIICSIFSFIYYLILLLHIKERGIPRKHTAPNKTPHSLIKRPPETRVTTKRNTPNKNAPETPFHALKR